MKQSFHLSLCSDFRGQLFPPAAAAPDIEVIVHCDCPNDYSVAKVAYRLRKAGFTSVRPLQGGVDAWIAAGLPVGRPDAAYSPASLP